ncbi:hypothetical protein C3B51_20630 [Pseudoalteromonas rubra]|uniref:Uncharacterized protein n=1 Tax=Pseudoalteromonas rubra TaxID=43658 RepID=A0A4Q7DY58_9GAMM|nr:hypothetical protein C3B51_20630 [Pseudoalteromonas rubra]
MPVQFEGANMPLTVLKISHLEQLNSKIFALLSTIFSRLKIEHLIKQIGISLTCLKKGRNCGPFC